jgi:hypothetical protein
MSVATLFNFPADHRTMAEWLFSNADSHRQIAYAIAQQKQKTIEFPPLDPMSEDDVQNWLLRHQFSHDQFEPILGIGGNDYTQMNFRDPRAVEFVWQQHANSHIQAHTILGISAS